MRIEETDDGVIIRVRVIPNASRNAVTRSADDGLVIRLASRPVEGKANKDLLRFLGKLLGIAPSCITIVRGQTSREKTIKISKLDSVMVKARLEECLQD